MKSKKFGYKIGDKIGVVATLEKDCDFTTDIHRLRKRIKCQKEGYVVGLRKKAIRWKVEYNESRDLDGALIDGHNYAVPIEADYIIEFKERIAGKTQEALLGDTILLIAVIDVTQ
jgi:hypothetical protein